MNLVVQKYGGASLATSERIKKISQKIKERVQTGEKLVVVVSAMGQATDSLIQLASEISARPNLRELDVLISSGERISMALLSMALNEINVKSISFTGSQAGILTTEDHFHAKIVGLRPERIRQALQDHQVVVVAGFQGVSEIKKEITTLGRGGSDTTAVALAVELGASRCEILKEVEGVFTEDPKSNPKARSIPEVSLDALARQALWGAKVVQHRAVRLAQKFDLPIWVGTALDQKIHSKVSSKGSSKEVARTLLKGVVKICVPKEQIGIVLEKAYNQKTLSELTWLSIQIDPQLDPQIDQPFDQQSNQRSNQRWASLFFKVAPQEQDLLKDWASLEIPQCLIQFGDCHSLICEKNFNLEGFQAPISSAENLFGSCLDGELHWFSING